MNLLEALNKGDFTEGLVAMAIYSFVKNGGVLGAADLNNVARRSLVLSKQEVTTHSDKVSFKLGGVSVGAALIVHLKTARVVGGFGSKLETSKEIDNLLGTIATELPKQTEMLLLKQLLDKAAGLSGALTFTVISDGIAGESSGGNLKGDVQVKISADQTIAENAEIRDLAKRVALINYSLKYDSSTAANLSPITGPVGVAKSIGLPGDAAIIKAATELEKTRLNLKQAKRSASQRATKQARQATYVATQKLIDVTLGSLFNHINSNFSGEDFDKLVAGLFGVFEHSVFGSDEAVLLNVQRNSIKTIRRENINAIKQLTIDTPEITVGVEHTGSILKVSLVNTDNKNELGLFQFRFKVAESSSDPTKPPEIKFYIETLPGAYYTLDKTKAALGIQ